MFINSYKASSAGVSKLLLVCSFGGLALSFITLGFNVYKEENKRETSEEEALFINTVILKRLNLILCSSCDYFFVFQEQTLQIVPQKEMQC